MTSILYRGDCSDVLKELYDTGVTVDAVITDPPYNISRDNNFKTLRDRKGRTGIDFGEWDKDADILSWIEDVSKIIKPNGNLIIFNSWENLSSIKIECEKFGLQVKRPLIFRKTNPAPFNRDRLNVNDIEFALWFVKGYINKKGEIKTKGWTFNRQDKLQSCVFNYVVESGGGFKKYHPTQKSVKQIKELIEIYTNEGDTILDAFSGSSTTGVACIETNRKFIGIELDNTHFQTSFDRIYSTYQNIHVLNNGCMFNKTTNNWVVS